MDEWTNEGGGEEGGLEGGVDSCKQNNISIFLLAVKHQNNSIL